jgi:methionine-rich copper-binding protein CopC
MKLEVSLRRFAIGGAAALIVAVLAVITTQLVSAHSRPIRFDPAPGSILTAAPAKIDGWFTAELRRDPNWNFIRAADAQGNRVDTGEPILSSDRRQMSVALRPGLMPGRYVVTWRTWDDGDTRIFGDCYAFFVGQAAADAAVNDKFRLDAGGSCQRIDISGRDGTPVAGGTPQATPGGPPVAEGHDDEDEDAETSGTSDDGGIPVWSLVLGIVAGVVVGGVGGRFVGRSH